MLTKEESVWAELLGKDSPEVKALVAAANAGMDVHEMLRSMVRQKGWDPDDPPKFSLPRDISKSDYIIGTAMSGDVVGEEVGLSQIELSSHLGVFGLSSVGKSTMVKLSILEFLKKDKNNTIFIFDVHGEYRDLLHLFKTDEFIWLPSGEIGINPFEPPVGADGNRVMSPEKWLNVIREWMRLLWLNEPSINLLCEIILEEYERLGVLTGSNNYPSLSDIIEALNLFSPARGSDRERAKGKLLDRLQSLRGQLPGLDVRRSRNFYKLMQRSVILDVSDVKDIALPVLFSLLLTLLWEVFSTEELSGIYRMLVLEEAHKFAGGHLDKRTADLNEGKPSSFLRDLRKTGTCGVIVSQLISDVAASVRGNLGTVISLRQGDRSCVHNAAASLNLAPWQEAEIAKLPPRHAIARFSRYKEPVYLAIKDARNILPEGLPPLGRAEALERGRLVLEANPYVRGSGPQADGESGSPAAAGAEGEGLPSAAGGGLPPTERKVFSRIAEQPWELIEDRMDSLGLDRETEGKARTNLGSRGLIVFAGKVGAKHRLSELTARGRELADTMGLAVAKTSKGSVCHEAIVQHVQRSLGRHSPAFRFQRTGISSTTADVQPDLLLILPGGGRIPIQACNANQPGYEASALLKLCKLAQLGPGDADRVDFVMAVAVNKRHRDAIERALKRQNSDDLPGRLVLLDFDSVIDPEFDWVSVFEMPL